MSGDRFELAEEALLDVNDIGHRRPDLTRRDVLFHKTFSYLIVYAPGTALLQVLSVLHGKRNVTLLLRERLQSS